MGSVKDIQNKSSEQRPVTSSLSSDDRIRLIANLIIDRVLEDQRNGKILFKKIDKK